MKSVPEILEVAITSSKIEIDEEEKKSLEEEIRQLQEWLEPFLQLNAEEVIPRYYSFKAVNVFREDEVREAVETEKLTGNSSTFEQGYYKIPPVLEE